LLDNQHFRILKSEVLHATPSGRFVTEKFEFIANKIIFGKVQEEPLFQQSLNVCSKHQEINFTVVEA